MDDYLIQLFMDIDQQIKSTIPGIIRAVELFNNSPVMIETKTIAEKVKETVPSTLQRFIEAIEPFQQLFLEGIDRIAPTLYQFANAINIIAPAAYLADMQFVWWKIPSKELIESIASAGNDKARTDILEEWIREYDPTASIIKLQMNKHLSKHKVFQQSIEAFEYENYNLAALGLTACFDKMLSECSGLPTHKIDKRVKELANRLEEKNKEDIILSEADFCDYYLIVTYQKSALEFNKTVPFTDPEPLNLNRHWIMHGRTERHMTKIECVKLINLIYGTILIAEMIGGNI